MDVVGFLGPQPYMKPAIEDMRTRLEVHELNPSGWTAAEMEQVAAECRDKGIAAVAGFAQKDAFQHILINEQLGNTTISRLAFLYCMNKYLMRTLEAAPFWFAPVDPLAQTDEEIIASIAEWPFMLKNTSLSLGRGIFKDEDGLRRVLASYRQDKELQALIAAQNKAFTEGIPADELPPVIPPFIAEHMVDMATAIEYCYEGYITADGEVVHYAMTEEVYFADHEALGYLTPPLTIGADAAPKIAAWVDDYMGRFADLGYRAQFFNLEFWILADGTIALTEINPRAAHSFHYNYWYSFGTSLFKDNLRLASSGTRLEHPTPWDMWLAGDVRQPTLIALITGQETGPVEEILDYDYVGSLEDEGVLIRHTRQRGDVLTEDDMTAAGVMLLQMWLTGASAKDVIAREREIRSRIYRHPQDKEYPDFWV
ncbi:ATP-grasp domain-containing protein [Actinomycetota bacterium]